MVMDSPGSSTSPDTDAVQDILRSLRRKEGTWVDWAQGCQALQKARFTPQQIFEETGFEPVHQNQIMVAEQVYQSILKVGVAEATQAHFTERGSDALYELRVLSQGDRATTADSTVPGRRPVTPSGAASTTCPRAWRNLPGPERPPVERA